MGGGLREPRRGPGCPNAPPQRHRPDATDPAARFGPPFLSAPARRRWARSTAFRWSRSGVRPPARRLEAGCIRPQGRWAAAVHRGRWNAGCPQGGSFPPPLLRPTPSRPPPLRGQAGSSPPAGLSTSPPPPSSPRRSRPCRPRCPSHLGASAPRPWPQCAARPSACARVRAGGFGVVPRAWAYASNPPLQSLARARRTLSAVLFLWRGCHPCVTTHRLYTRPRATGLTGQRRPPARPRAGHGHGPVGGGGGRDGRQVPGAAARRDRRTAYAHSGSRMQALHRAGSHRTCRSRAYSCDAVTCALQSASCVLFLLLLLFLLFFISCCPLLAAPSFSLCSSCPRGARPNLGGGGAERSARAPAATLTFAALGAGAERQGRVGLPPLAHPVQVFQWHRLYAFPPDRPPHPPLRPARLTAARGGVDPYTVASSPNAEANGAPADTVRVSHGSLSLTHTQYTLSLSLSFDAERFVQKPFFSSCFLHPEDRKKGNSIHPASARLPNTSLVPGGDDGRAPAVGGRRQATCSSGSLSRTSAPVSARASISAPAPPPGAQGEGERERETEEGRGEGEESGERQRRRGEERRGEERRGEERELYGCAATPLSAAAASAGVRSAAARHGAASAGATSS
eukprot:SAG11_NODE_1754_length_4311_cov_3.917379_3_plen_626_part_00